MTIGPLLFAQPWLLLGLASLPAIWWLLRATPPRPRTVPFAAVRLLRGLLAKDQTPARTPWWLALIRMLAAALIILALAEPVLNPPAATGSGGGPLVIVVDNGWDAAKRWRVRRETLERLISHAESEARPTMLVTTAGEARMAPPAFRSPAETRKEASAIVPHPWPPERLRTLARLKAALAKLAEKGPQLAKPEIVWLASALDHGQGAAFARGLAALAAAGDGLTMVSFAGADAPLGLRALPANRAKLAVEVISPGGAERAGTVVARDARGQRLGQVAFRIARSEKSTKASFDLPLEIANQVARIEIKGERTAAAVHLLDGRSRWHRVGLISGAAQEEAQPLLSPIYYIERALVPYADLAKASSSNMAEALDEIFARDVSALALANIGKIVGQSSRRIRRWIERGGILIRFAGPRLEKAGDALLPVALRFGGRTLGGALSWSEPQPLAQFDDKSLFAGLNVPQDVRVRRQVLADPARLGTSVEVWARLSDGTPLVTARRIGTGWTVLFHVTANSDWSNLPHSGLFVEMLRRLLTLSKGPVSAADPRLAESTTSSPVSSSSADRPASATASATAGDARGRGAATDGLEGANVLAPLTTLDGFGVLGKPPAGVEPLLVAALAETRPSAKHPPGRYGSGERALALNLITKDTRLAPLAGLPSSMRRKGYESQGALPLKAWAFLLALLLVFADILAVMAIQAGALWKGRARAARAASSPLLLGVLAVLLAPFFVLGLGIASSGAQTQPPPSTPSTTPGDAIAKLASDAFALKASLTTRFAYVLTGDAEVDRVSRLGLEGLGRILAARTAVEPGKPIGVDVTKDELAFFPLIYWPVTKNARPLDDKTLAKIDAYMKQGGMLLFDTRDQGLTIPGPAGTLGPGSRALKRLLAKLDVPRLEPVPEGHVLTKSFYLLSAFPGRWEGGALWVEADETSSRRGNGDLPSRVARRADGVSSILITSNDFASAWALDEFNRPLFPVVPGGAVQREMAYRTGINIVMYALTGNYKADQVHVPALLERLGQ